MEKPLAKIVPEHMIYANPEDDPFRKAMKAAAKKLNHSPNSPSEPQPEPVTAQV
jgi:hypothetical protein